MGQKVAEEESLFVSGFTDLLSELGLWEQRSHGVSSVASQSKHGPKCIHFQKQIPVEPQVERNCC